MNIDEELIDRMLQLQSSRLPNGSSIDPEKYPGAKSNLIISESISIELDRMRSILLTLCESALQNDFTRYSELREELEKHHHNIERLLFMIRPRTKQVTEKIDNLKRDIDEMIYALRAPDFPS